MRRNSMLSSSVKSKRSEQKHEAGYGLKQEETRLENKRNENDDPKLEEGGGLGSEEEACGVTLKMTLQRK